MTDQGGACREGAVGREHAFSGKFSYFLSFMLCNTDHDVIHNYLLLARYGGVHL
jgi:hypothetical protein